MFTFYIICVKITLKYGYINKVLDPCFFFAILYMLEVVLNILIAL